MKDITGAVLSFLCICHCVLVPIAIMVGGTGAVLSVMGDESVHLMLIVPVFIVGVLSFPPGIKAHGSYTPAITGGIGFLLLLFEESIEFGNSEVMGLAVPLLAGALLGFAHLRNRHLYQVVQKDSH